MTFNRTQVLFFNEELTPKKIPTHDALFSTPFFLFGSFFVDTHLFFRFVCFFFLALFSFLAHAEWNRLRNYHRLQKIIETITMQRAIKSTITQRNIIHTSPCMMMKSKILAISTEMVSSSMNCSYWNGL